MPVPLPLAVSALPLRLCRVAAWDPSPSQGSQSLGAAAAQPPTLRRAQAGRGPAQLKEQPASGYARRERQPGQDTAQLNAPHAARGVVPAKVGRHVQAGRQGREEALAPGPPRARRIHRRPRGLEPTWTGPSVRRACRRPGPVVQAVDPRNPKPRGPSSTLVHRHGHGPPSMWRGRWNAVAAPCRWSLARHDAKGMPGPWRTYPSSQHSSTRRSATPPARAPARLPWPLQKAEACLALPA
mmetsp:Transcript_52721/g.112799  ORF Transcript_52721/g.112799 Transcript_52721/m.112799 type:complete len:240 (+) Transcript_52721:195-914(+)